ncbi:hypothetical protein CDD83_3215 [Cordyceps sp. RAO-2017]|nr:hypothetical protein CDD83_3215 [Cordyceps sp. RAO-2017]
MPSARAVRWAALSNGRVGARGKEVVRRTGHENFPFIRRPVTCALVTCQGDGPVLLGDPLLGDPTICRRSPQLHPPAGGYAAMAISPSHTVASSSNASSSASSNDRSSSRARSS